MSARISPASPPFSGFIQARLDALMPQGMKPLALFTTLAKDERLFARFMGGGLLDVGHLSLRQREVVINRVTAQCGAEYEWGVHITIFGKEAGFDSEHQHSFRYGGAEDPCWTVEDRLLIQLCDSLFETCDLTDELWSDLRKNFTDVAMIELLMIAGFYRTVSYLTNALRLPLEPGSTRFS